MNIAAREDVSRQMAGNPLGSGPLEAGSSEARARISALVDGELDRAAAEQVIDRLLVDPQLRAVWESYHLVGDSLRSDELIGEAEGAQGAARFAALLDAEPTVLAPRRRQQRPIWQRLAMPGAAAAAALVMVVFVAASQFGGQTGGVLQASPATPAPPVAQRPATPLDSARLNEYLVAHPASAASWRDPGMVRAVGLSTTAGQVGR